MKSMRIFGSLPSPPLLKNKSNTKTSKYYLTSPFLASKYLKPNRPLSERRIQIMKRKNMYMTISKCESFTLKIQILNFQIIENTLNAFLF